MCISQKMEVIYTRSIAVDQTAVIEREIVKRDQGDRQPYYSSVKRAFPESVVFVGAWSGVHEDHVRP